MIKIVGHQCMTYEWAKGKQLKMNEKIQNTSGGNDRKPR